MRTIPVLYSSVKSQNNMSKWKVRFHLARGENFQKWQIKTKNESGITHTMYIEPDDVMLEMTNAKLRNQRKTAERILGGENKSVCAWVECDDLKVRQADPFAPPSPGHFIYYNPKRRAHWHDEAKQDLDNRTYNCLTTFGRLIIAPHEEKA